MPARPAPARAKPSSQDTTAAVDAFMQALEHPFKTETETLRRIVLGADASIDEGVKWNAPSFRTSEYFATVHLRGKGTIGLVLHLGAKARALPAGGLAIDDPSGLLKWLGTDRAIVAFKGMDEIRARTAALQAVLRQWIAHA